MLAGAYPWSAALGVGGRHPTQTSPGTHHAPLRTPTGEHGASIRAEQGGSSVSFLPTTPAPGCSSGREGTAGDVTDATYVGAKGVAAGGPRGCSGFVLEERRTGPALRTAAGVKDKEKPFRVQGCRCLCPGFPGTALTPRGVGLRSWSQGSGRGWQQPCPTSACISAVLHKVLSGPTQRQSGTFVRVTEKDPCTGARSSVLRPRWDLGTVARDAAGGRGSVLTSMPGFPGGPSGPGVPGSPLAPFEREEAGGQVDRSSTMRGETVGELGEGTGTHRRPRGSGRAFVTLGKEKEVIKRGLSPTEPGLAARGAQDLCLPSCSPSRRKMLDPPAQRPGRDRAGVEQREGCAGAAGGLRPFWV